MTNLEILASTLSESDKRRLSLIYAPTVVGVQPMDARRDLILMPDGELRSYGYTEKTSVFNNNGQKVYLSSRNCGLDWKLCYAPAQTALGAAIKLPWSDRWLTIPDGRDGVGTFAYLSEIGPDDISPRAVKLSDIRYIDMFQPEVYPEKHRVLCCGHHTKPDGYQEPVVMYSDDDGESWTLVPLKSTPKHTPVYPHLGVRWQNTGTESTFTRLADGRLMLFARTSLDYLYVYYSADLGETWTDGEPSPFHCTLTTPYLLKLSDGRTVFFWNNTRPLAEENHDTQNPPVSDWVKSGNGEDVFTNRDANHVAISDDCFHWTGFRELGLNEVRNAPDFRVKGGWISSNDKSVHQFQAMELPMGKILVEYGQHEISRRMVIFDVNWLYETTRVEDWQMGLKNVSTHLYVKSLSDCHVHTGFAGHCAWNRTDGALLVPDPDLTWGEALQICRVRDKRLVSDKQGMVWNFPMAYKGEITLQLRVEGAGVAVRLCDHWMNPMDPQVGRYALYDFALDKNTVAPGVWHEVVITYDSEACTGMVSCDGIALFTIPMTNPAPQGVSYLHVQTLAEETDFDGTLIRRMEFRGMDNT